MQWYFMINNQQQGPFDDTIQCAGMKVFPTGCR